MKEFNRDAAHAICRMCQGFRRSPNGYKEIRKGNREHEFSFVESGTCYIENFRRILEAENICREHLVIDLGCGVSSILIYLNLIDHFHRLYGVDNEIDFIKPLRDILNVHKYNIMKGSLHRMNREIRWTISMAHVVYSFQPIADIKLYHSFVNRTINLMKPGAIFVDFYGPWASWVVEDNIRESFGNWYFKKQ